MNTWKTNNLLPTNKENFVDAKMSNLMNFLNAEDLSSNESIVSEIHLDESINLKEATMYNPKEYNFAASSFHMTLDELEDMVKNDIGWLNTLIKDDEGIQSRYSGIEYSKEEWLEKINYLRENIEFYKPERFGTQYVKGYRSITLNKYLDFNPEQPGVCWSWNKEYQQKNEKAFIIGGTGNGDKYLLRLKAVFKNEDIDWVKTIYLLRNDEGELRLHPDRKAYILDKLIYGLGSKNREELGVENVANSERRHNVNPRLNLKKYYNPETKRYDIVDTSGISLKDIYKSGEFIIPIGIWNDDLTLSYLKSFKNCPTHVSGNFNCEECNNLTSLEGAPEYVGGGFRCRNCNNLTSLEGAPEYVGGNFNCYNCKSLRSLEGAPKHIDRSFYCGQCNNLTSLEGAPEYVGDYFDCSVCRNLTSLEGAPKEVGGDFNCSGPNGLISLKGAPEKVGGRFECRWCNGHFTEEEVRAVCDVKGNVII